MNLIDQWGLEANRLDTLDGPPLGEVTIFGRYYPSVGSNMSTNDWNSIIGYSPNTDTGEWSTPFIPYVPEGGGASGGNRISSNKSSRKVDPKTIQQIRLLMEFLKKYGIIYFRLVYLYITKMRKYVGSRAFRPTFYYIHICLRHLFPPPLHSFYSYSCLLYLSHQKLSLLNQKNKES